MDAESQRDSTLVTVVRGVAGDGHCAVDGHLVLLTVLCYVERVWRKLKRKKGAFGELAGRVSAHQVFIHLLLYKK